MFRIGDYVAHYKEGVCEVVNIGKSGFFCYTTSYIETMICSDLYRDEQKQEW